MNGAGRAGASGGPRATGTRSEPMSEPSRAGTPRVTRMQVIPVAGRDSMLLNPVARTRRTSRATW